MNPGSADFPNQLGCQSLREKMQRDLGQAGIELVAALPGTRWHLVDIWGQVHLADLVVDSSLGASLEELRKADQVVLVEVAGYADFHAQIVAKVLRSQLEALGKVPQITSLRLALPELETKTSLTAAEIAQVLDRPGQAQALAQRLATAWGESALGPEIASKTAVWLFPPVLGFRCQQEILTAIHKVTGVQAAELLATLPSIPGFRWQQALDRQLAWEGIPVVVGQAEALAPGPGNGGTLSHAWIDMEGRRQQVVFRSVVLATGGLIGGGLGGPDQVLSEPLVGLPVFMGNQQVDGKPSRQLIQEGTHAQQRLWCSGVRVDGLCRPVGEDQKPLYPNLFAAGALVQGAGLLDGGLGAAYITGVWAGQEAAKWLVGGEKDE